MVLYPVAVASEGSADLLADAGVWEQALVATVDPSLIRGLGTGLTMDTSQGCLALSTSVGVKPLRDEDEGSLDRRPAEHECGREAAPGRGRGFP
jgi:hypothetical protein